MQPSTAITPLAYSLDGLAKAAGLGRTTVFAAVRSGELKTVTPTINGKRLKRKRVTPEDARKWIESFPNSGEV